MRDFILAIALWVSNFRRRRGGGIKKKKIAAKKEKKGPIDFTPPRKPEMINIDLSKLKRFVLEDKGAFQYKVDVPDHQKYLYVFDNGHGSLVGGKQTPLFQDGSRMREYEYNRAICYYLMQLMDLAGLAYVNLVPEVEIHNEYGLRVRRIKRIARNHKKPLRVISIHGNAFGNGDWNNASGIETWFQDLHGRMAHLSELSFNFSDTLQKALVAELRLKSRGLKSRKVLNIFNKLKAIESQLPLKDQDSDEELWEDAMRKEFWILKNGSVTSLVEIGFMTNFDDANRMKSNGFRLKAALGLFQGIRNYEANS